MVARASLPARLAWRARRPAPPSEARSQSDYPPKKPAFDFLLFTFNFLFIANINEHYSETESRLSFPGDRPARQGVCRGKSQSQDHPRLGIGDVTEPLPPAVARGHAQGRGRNGPARDLPGLRAPSKATNSSARPSRKNDFQSRSCDVSPDEIFVSDGGKCDTGNILDVFGPQNIIAVTDPVYPVYVDTNVMAGHTGPANETGEYAGLVYLPMTAENDFIPPLPTPKSGLDLSLLPQQPDRHRGQQPNADQVGRVCARQQAIIFFDAAYEAYITDPAMPHSIYEIPGAREVAIEFRSFSKTAGFTGTRCAFTVVPKS